MESYTDYLSGSPEDAFPLDAPLPDKIQFGLSNRCNLKCTYCVDHYPGFAAPDRNFTSRSVEEMKKER